MSTSVICRAKNPAECRFHGTARLAPMPSAKAFKELTQAKSAWEVAKSSHAGSAAVEKLYGQFLEARANYGVTKEGLAEARNKFEETQAKMLSTDETEGPEVEALAARFGENYYAVNEYSSSRQCMLEEYAEALVEKEFANDDANTKLIAKWGAFNNFASFGQFRDFSEEIEREVSAEEFYSRLVNPDFSARLAKIEATFADVANDGPDPLLETKHAKIRDQIRSSVLASGGDFDEDHLFYKAKEANQESFLN